MLWRKCNKVSGHYTSQLLLDTILQSNGSGPMSEIHVKEFLTLLYCNSMYQMYQIKPNIIIDYNNFLVSCVNIEIDTVVMKVVAVLYSFKKLALKNSYND